MKHFWESEDSNWEKGLNESSNFSRKNNLKLYLEKQQSLKRYWSSAWSGRPAEKKYQDSLHLDFIIRRLVESAFLKINFIAYNTRVRIRKRKTQLKIQVFVFPSRVPKKRSKLSLDNTQIKLIELIQNFTDVDDKIINRAKEQGESASGLSTKYIQTYFEDSDRLNIRRATNYPKATEHIDDMINLIQNLVDKESAYVSKNGVYFRVSKFSEYGKLSKKKTEDLESGARIEVDESKESPLDFALWKFSDEQPNWESPWGKGRPGWHIECSAMSIKYLGKNFEIHGGGRDLIFPHHENEIAQSESFTSEQFAKIWMHAGMITINGEKISKSVGNV